MTQQLRQTIYNELNSIRLIDPHTHINALQPASQDLFDILGYHYYTELAHSAGLPREQIEDESVSRKERVGRLMTRLADIDNTVQFSWFVEIANRLFDCQCETVDESNWEKVFDAAQQKMAEPNWDEQVLEKSNLEAVFLTNDFDDPLEGFDTRRYIPCLRTDDLVFHFSKSSVRERLAKATSLEVSDSASFRSAIGKLFEHFKAKNAKACAISLPPNFSPCPVSAQDADSAIQRMLSQGDNTSVDDQRTVSQYAFWTLAEFCQEFGLPFDLMIGVNRGVYAAGVFQGQDLYDSRVSLIQYRELFNAFPKVTFPISVLASVTNQELASYAWIFPNVVTNGHWWYSNTPTFIEHDASARLEAVPKTKQIAYYSDMYKLEFALPKFNMYKRILSKILAERFVVDRNWSESQAIELGKRVLRTNVESIFDC